jgi:hypothetical protein
VASRAAIEAGYSRKSAYVIAHKLIRNPQIRQALEGRRIIKTVHAEKTYENLVTVANAALKVLADAMTAPAVNFPGRSERLRMAAIDCAGRALERVARCEGLMLPPEAGSQDGRPHTLQQIVQVINNYAMVLKGGNGNGNGSHNGNGKEAAGAGEELPQISSEEGGNGNGHAEPGE